MIIRSVDVSPMCQNSVPKLKYELSASGEILGSFGLAGFEYLRVTLFGSTFWTLGEQMGRRDIRRTFRIKPKTGLDLIQEEIGAGTPCQWEIYD